MNNISKKEILQPKDKDELVQFIKDEINLNGNNCDLNHIDTFLITDMSFLFSKKTFWGGYDLHEFNGTISFWNTSNVKFMNHMFSFSDFNQDISNWNTSSVTNMNHTFYSSKFVQNINCWDTSNVTDMSYMFSLSQFNKDISSWDTSNVTDMEAMFSYSQFNQDISDWNTSNVKFMRHMFLNSQFSQDISKWNISSVTNIHNMFRDSKITKIPQWDYFKIDNIKYCFDNCFQFIEILPDWYQFNYIDNAHNRQKTYDNYLKSKKLNKSISNNLIIKKKSINKI